MVSVFREGDSLNYYKLWIVNVTHHCQCCIQHPEPARVGHECVDATHHIEWDVLSSCTNDIPSHQAIKLIWAYPSLWMNVSYYHHV